MKCAVLEVPWPSAITLPQQLCSTGSTGSCSCSTIFCNTANLGSDKSVRPVRLLSKKYSSMKVCASLRFWSFFWQQRRSWRLRMFIALDRTCVLAGCVYCQQTCRALTNHAIAKSVKPDGKSQLSASNEEAALFLAWQRQFKESTHACLGNLLSVAQYREKKKTQRGNGFLFVLAHCSSFHVSCFIQSFSCPREVCINRSQLYAPPQWFPH